MRRNKRNRHEQEDIADGMIAEQIPPPELGMKGRQLADLCTEIDAMRAAAAADASSARKKIRAKENERRVLQEEIRTGTRQVPRQQRFGVVEGGSKGGNGHAGDVEA